MVPQVIGPMIIVIGFNLIPSAFGMAKTNFLVAGITLATALAVIKFGKGFIGQVSILIALLVGYGVSAALHIVDYSPVIEAAAFAMPKFQAPKFSIGAIATIAPIVLAVLMEHLGDITTNSTIVGKNFIKDPGLHRTLLGDGIATMAAGFVGGPANTTYGENSAVLAITKNYDPSLLRLAAIFALCVSFVGKLGRAKKHSDLCPRRHLARPLHHDRHGRRTHHHPRQSQTQLEKHPRHGIDPRHRIRQRIHRKGDRDSTRNRHLRQYRHRRTLTCSHRRHRTQSHLKPQ